MEKWDTLKFEHLVQDFSQSPSAIFLLLRLRQHGKFISFHDNLLDSGGFLILLQILDCLMLGSISLEDDKIIRGLEPDC